MTFVQAADTVNGAHDFLFSQWRTATHPVPAQQQFQHDIGIHPMPEQVTGQRGDGIVSLPFRYSFPNEVAPVIQAMPSALADTGCLLQQPSRQGRKRGMLRVTALDPSIGLATGMHGGRGYYTAPITSYIDAGVQPYLIP